MTTSHIKNIAIIGGSGNLGSLVIKHLLSTQKFHLTILTRSSSTVSFPISESITIKRGDYSPSFLKSAFEDQDAAVLALNFNAVPDTETMIIKAAAAAGLKWILPAEFGSDNDNPVLRDGSPLNAMKTMVRERIEKLAGTYEGLSWIGVVCNPWFDWSLARSMFAISASTKSATLLNNGTSKFNTTNLSTVALSISRLLSLPLTTLSTYANKFLYISSFLVSQRDIIDSVQRVTETTDADWEIEVQDGEEFIKEGRERVEKRDFGGMVNMLYGPLMTGKGGDYESVRGLSNEILGLESEDLDESVRRALKGEVAV